MSERPKNGADPDATVIIPAGRSEAKPDDDATVMIPAQRDARSDDDATVMIPAVKVDDDATVMIPSRPAAQADDDATVMIPAARSAPSPGPKVDEDATVMMPVRAAAAPAAEVEPDAEATIAIPTPGRKRDAESPALPAAPAAAAAADAASLGGINPLVAAANPVLAVVAHIRQTLKHPDPQGLRASLNQNIDAFTAAARGTGAGEETVSAAVAALRALVDESLASTPWGAALTTSGGEDVFASLEKLSVAAPANKDLLEFFYVCLALGLEGRYRDAPDARQALVEVRGKLLEQLRPLRPARDGELSAHWRGVQAPARPPAGALGLWLAASAAALLLAALYVGYSIWLGGLSDPVARELAQLKAPAEPERPRTAASAPTPRIAEQLVQEISRGEVAVADGAGMSTIVIRSDRLFASGSARLESGIEPVVLRVAEALEKVPGTIVVTGHSDDVPIRTARFPSNWELSNERAASVMKLMAGKVKDSARMRAEGLADSAPAAPNDSAANRARNRRVEILLRSAP